MRTSLLRPTRDIVFGISVATSLLVAQAKQTRFRVVDAVTHAAIQGATVHVLTQDLAWLVPMVHQTVREAVTDERGDARIELDPGKFWSAWATKSDDDRRVASFLIGDVEPGRPLRLECHEMTTRRVRLEGLDEWRDVCGSPIRAVFVAENPVHWYMLQHQLADGAVPRMETSPISAAVMSPVFVIEKPLEGDSAEVEVPPLPFGYYFASIGDARAEALFAETRLSPISLPQEGDFTDNRSTLTVEFAAPDESAIRVESANGRGIENVLVTGEMGSRLVTKRTTDAGGRCLLGSTTPRTVFLHAPNRVRNWRHVENLELNVRLDVRTVTTIELRAARRGDRLYTTSDNSALQLEPTSVHVERGVMEFEALDDLGRSGLVLVRDGEPILLPDVRARADGDEQRAVIDLDALQEIEFDVTSGRDETSRRIPYGGFVEVWQHDAKFAFFNVRLPLDARGHATTRLAPGRYRLLVRHPTLGDSLTDLHVASQDSRGQRAEVEPQDAETALPPLRVPVTLQPFVEARLHLESTLEGPFMVYALCGVRKPDRVAQTLANYDAGPHYLDKPGVLRLRASSRLTIVRVVANACRQPGRTPTVTQDFSTTEDFTMVVR
ncbi:MAG: hypothetical protein H6832_19035 [Planctomycetes bacterium]|nr:hypothetical protein [Planctomycetota bacterium]MCB9920505.1 hypothetical protein [Planctomycetota bacterium]